MPSSAFTAVTFGMSTSHVRVRKVTGVHHPTLAPSSAMTLVPLHEAQANPEIKYRDLYEEAQGPRVIELSMGIQAQRDAAIKYRGL